MARRGVGRDRGKERFWRGVLRQWRRCGLSVREFCAEVGVSEPSFYFWRRVLGERDQERQQKLAPPGSAQHLTDPACDSAGAPVRFVPLHVVSTPTSATATSATATGAAATGAAATSTGLPFEIVFGDGRVLRVPASFEAASLRQLLAVLQEEQEERPC